MNGARAALKWGAICAGAVVILCAGILIGAHLYLATDTGARRLMGLINGRIPGTISGRTLSIALLQQTAAIDGAALKGPDGKTIIQAERVDLTLDLPALLRNRLVFRTIHLRKPIGTLAFDADGRLNIVSAFKEPTPEPSAIAVYIRDLRSTGGTLVFQLPQGAGQVRMQDLRLNLAAAFAADTRLRLAIPSSRLSLSLAERDIDGGHCVLSAELVNDRIDGIRLALSKSSSRLGLAGAVSGLSDKARIKARLDIDAEPMDFVPDLARSLAGRLVGAVSAEGVYDNPTIRGELVFHAKTEAPAAGADEIGFHPKSVSFSGVLSDRVLTCTAVQVDLAPGVIDLTGTIDLRPVFRYFGDRHANIKGSPPISHPSSPRPGGRGPIAAREPSPGGDRFRPEAVAYDLAVAGHDIRLSSLHKDLRGTAWANLAVQGRGYTPADLTLAVSGMAGVTGFAVGALKKTDLRVAGRGTYRAGTIRCAPVTLTAPGATLRTRGSVKLASRAIDGTLELWVPKLERLLAHYALDARGALSARATVTGTLDRPAAHMTLQGENCAWRDIALGDLALDTTLEPSGVVTLHRGDIRNRASTITAAGTVGLFKGFPHPNRDLPLTLTAELAEVNPADFAPRLRLAGAFAGRITAAADRSSLAGEIHLEGRDCAYAEAPIGRIALDATLGEGRLRLARLNLEKDRSALGVAGAVRVLEADRLAVCRDPEIDLRITDGRLRLEDFSAALSGAVDVSGELRGTLAHPQGTAALAGKDLDLGFQKLAALNLAARFDQDRLWIDPATALIAPGQEIRGRGWFSLQGAYALEVSTPGISLAAIDRLKQRDGLTGIARLDLSGEGSLEHPRLSGTLSLHDLRYLDKALPDSRLSLDLTDQRLSAAGTFLGDVQGTYDLETRGMTASAAFHDTDLAPFFALAGRPALRGTVSGTATAAGAIDKPRSFAVSADLAGLTIAQENRPLVQADTLRGSFVGGTLAIPRTQVRLAERGSLVLYGSGTLRDGLVFDAAGSVPAEVIGAFVSGVEDAGGTIDFSSQIRSRAGHTGIKARITLADCAYQIPYNGQRIHGVNGIIRLEDQRIAVIDLAGRLDSGTFKLDGSGTLEGFTRLKELDVRAKAKAVPVVVPDTMDLTVDADARLSVADRPALKAALTILDGQYYKDMNVDLLAGVAERILPRPPAIKTPPPTPPSFLRDLALEVDIKRRGTLQVENNLAALEINPDLRVTGTLAAPIVNGRVSVTDGTVTVQGNTFTVTRGVIDFVNPYRTEAALDIVSQTKVRDWTITLTLSGPLDDLLVELNSTPAEEQSDILSLLVIGKTARELTQQQASMSVSPSGMLAELLADTYGAEIKKATSLDILRLESSSIAGKMAGEHIKLTVGKELSRRMTVTYEMETKNSAMVQRGIAAYKLLDNVLINGYQGSDGIFGAEVQLRHEFR